MTKLSFARAAGAVLVALSLSVAAPAFAFDTPTNDTTDTTPTPKPKPVKVVPAVPTLDTARADIKAGNWVKAIADLKLVVKASPKNADGWNLLGFSYRNHGDLKLADAAYDRALKLNPNHTGALSYQGLLYIKMGEVDEAKENLAKIKQLCGNTTCAEYVALNKALS
jgi:Flp pilus assembly protein TadD